MFKKIYIEITNSCNFNCSFCYPSVRKKKTMSVEEFQFVVEKIKPFTRYVYLHVLGEPLLHPQFEQILDIAAANDLFVNITTNGSLIGKHKELLINKPVRQINISLHDWEENMGIVGADLRVCPYDRDERILKDKHIGLSLHDLFHFAQQIAPTTYTSFRLWNRMGDAVSPFTEECLAVISDYFHTDKQLLLECCAGETFFAPMQNIRLSEHIFLQNSARFDWRTDDSRGVAFRLRSMTTCNAPTNNPTPKNCLALRDHIAILSDGSVVPCCIDADANLLLGNIFTDDLTGILSSPKAKNIKEGFARGEAVEEYCRSCGFR